MQKVQVEIRNGAGEAAAGEKGSSPETRRTKLVPKDNLVWEEDFYYNNNVLLDDNISFVLRGENQANLASTEVRNLSLLRKAQKEGESNEEGAQVGKFWGS